MKKNILRVILIILIIITFIKIFNFSNQDGDESSNLSRKVTITITKNIKKIQNLEQSKKENVLEILETIIRKMAHFTEYAFVGFLIMTFMSTYNLKQRYRFIISLVIGFLYACSDEIHQLFVPGRSSQITDVMIDTAGVCAGILILIVISKIIHYVKICIDKKKI